MTSISASFVIPGPSLDQDTKLRERLGSNDEIDSSENKEILSEGSARWKELTTGLLKAANKRNLGRLTLRKELCTDYFLSS